MLQPEFAVFHDQFPGEVRVGLVEGGLEHVDGTGTLFEAAEQAVGFLGAESESDFESAAFGGKLGAVRQRDALLQWLELGIGVVHTDSGAVVLFRAQGFFDVGIEGGEFGFHEIIVSELFLDKAK